MRNPKRPKRLVLICRRGRWFLRTPEAPAPLKGLLPLATSRESDRFQIGVELSRWESAEEPAPC